MAKSRGSYNDGVDIGELQKIAEKKEGSDLNGILNFVLYPFRDSAKEAQKLIDKEIKRVSRLGKAEEKKDLAQQIINRQIEKYYEKLDKKTEQELENVKNQKKALEDEKRQRDENFRNQQSLQKIAINKLNLEKQALKNQGKDTTSIENDIKAINESMLKEAKDKEKEDFHTEKRIASLDTQIATIDDNIKRGLANILLQNKDLRKLGTSEKDIFDSIEYQAGNGVDKAKIQEQIAEANYDLASYENFLISKGDIQSKSAGGKGRSLDLDDFDLDDRPARLTKGIITPRLQAVSPKAQQLESALGLSSPDLSESINAPITSNNLMQRNMAENLRQDEIAHRTEREALTDEFRRIVVENLKEQTYQQTTIQANQHHLFEALQQGMQGSGGGLLDSLLNFGAIKGAGGILSKGAGLATKVATKIPLIAGLFGAGKGIYSGFQTDDIAKQKGIDPSEVGIGDRIHYGLSGFLSGVTGGLISTDTVANGTEAIGNFLFGKSNATKARESKAQELSDEAEMNALLASRGIIQTADGYTTNANSDIHSQILQEMGVETPQKRGQELAELNEGQGGSDMLSSVVNNTTNTTNIIPENPRFRINDQATMLLSAQGL